MKTVRPLVFSRWLFPGAISLALVLVWISSASGQGLADDLLGTAEGVPAQGGSAPESDARAGDPEAGEQGQTPEELWEEAKQMAASGNCAAAIERYTQFIAANEQFVPAYFERGKCLAELGEYELALQSLSTAAVYGRQLPASYLINLERGKIYLKQGQYREAKDDFDLAVQAKPTDPELLYWRGRTLNRLAQQFGAMGGQETADLYEQARTSLDRAIRLNADYPEAHVERALSRSFLGEADEALEDMITATELDPANPQYAGRLGLFYLQRADGKRSDAERDEEVKAEMIADYEAGIAALSRLITVEAANRAEEETAADDDVADEDEVVENYGIDEDEQLQLEDAYSQRARARLTVAGEYPEGSRTELYQGVIDDSNALLDLEPNSPLALLQRGSAQRMLDQDDEAAKSYAEALEIAPDFSEARIRRGILFFHEGDYRMALADFQHAAPGGIDGRAYFWIGASHAQLGDFADAMRAYTKALQQNPNYTPAYNNRALIYLHLGRYELAIKDLNELLRRDPDDQIARQRRELAEDRIRAELATTGMVAYPAIQSHF